MGAWWSYALAPFGLAGMFIAGRRSRNGWLLSIFTQILWLIYAVNTRQWGFIPGSLAYGIIYFKNYLNWREDSWTTKRTSPDPAPLQVENISTAP